MTVRLEFQTQDPEEIALATRYWAMNEDGGYLEKVSELVPFREVTQSGLIAKYVWTFCHAFDENQACRKCEGPILITSRTDVKKQFQLSEAPCEACSEILRLEELERRRVAEVELQNQLATRIDYMRTASISYADLTDDQCFILLAIDALITPRLAHGTFTEDDCEALAPWEGTSYLTRLFRGGVIFDDPEAARSGTYYLQDEKLQAIPSSLQFFLPADESLGRGAEALETITERQLTDSEAMTNLWLDYAVGDVLRYLMEQCRVYSHDLDYEDIEKIRATVRFGLHTYSVSQLWFIMWKVVRDAASLANREYYNRYKAAATIPNKIRKQIERAEKQGGIDRYWERPELHIAGSLGVAFLTLFEIDESTEGKQALAIFAQLSVQASTGEVHGVANNFMQGALSRNVSFWAMEQFAGLIRAGFDTNGALDELVRLNPETFSVAIS
ncbi:hypothetical protein NVV94_21500 [Pseudomonas sp. LS1212]|uniref:hypothetical protein n=1 Tax=Pseudomonas sp. LS1212 TaxID=2972478 RepID=UPI00215D3D2C|nr:hypothetical protein [Pseudomonas sp. LS1212]UVJ43122.1 hypothetical protein NVV94_21500 [Pseudomonas sp. LS1212]